MNSTIRNHYLSFSQFTYPGLYKEYLETLPKNVRELGLLIRKQLIHRTTLEAGNVGSNADLIYGDMTKVPWYRQAEDDYFNTSVAIIAELFRRDSRGFILNRKAEDKLVLTCRHTTLLTATLLKTHSIPTRVRSGFAPYFSGMHNGKSGDHWINEYFDEKENRWVAIDVDGSLHDTGFDMYDIPSGKFDFAPVAWLDVRAGKVDGNHFRNDKPKEGIEVVAWELFYDFHCLMNNEIIYPHIPKYIYQPLFQTLTEKELNEIDHLATLMLDPDKNFDELVKIWNTNKKFRVLKGGLL